ncbi:MAG: hypothetical protein KYX69_06090 [Sphingomonas sp.]|uniref:hypothetical protein n=1 Tax=Sphingomonas sp. TaxID=28214 RepID=UPI002616BF78|nr:hypothetical protein [Sphingomonas sp.]MDK2767274.1 hypothetical protein [Sphingomonas sp.]
MSKAFLVVEDVFDVTGRGLIVVPGPLQDEYAGPREFPVTLRTPEGIEHPATLTLEHMFQSPPPKEHRWVCLLRDVTKAGIPIGTEIWASEP